VYFDSLNRLGVTHKCHRQTDGRTDGHSDSPHHNISPRPEIYSVVINLLFKQT